MKESEVISGLQKQLIELQSQLAFQEDTISALDRVVAAQQRQLDMLQELSKHQKLQLDQLSDRFVGDNDNQPPPHY